MTLFGLALWLLSGAPVQAASGWDLCARLFLPEGYQLDCAERGSTASKEPTAIVRPIEGPFAPLSELSIRPLDGPVDDPKTWLREQLKIDVSGFEDAMTGLVQSPDSPFAGSSIAEQLRNWRALLDSLAGLPLEGCDEPRASTSGEGWEMACEWPLGPLQQFLVLRLAERDGRQYAVRIRTMNEKRLRHLVAIANSF